MYVTVSIKDIWLIFCIIVALYLSIDLCNFIKIKVQLVKEGTIYVVPFKGTALLRVSIG